MGCHFSTLVFRTPGRKCIVSTLYPAYTINTPEKTVVILYLIFPILLYIIFARAGRCWLFSFVRCGGVSALFVQAGSCFIKTTPGSTFIQLQ